MRPENMIIYANTAKLELRFPSSPPLSSLAALFESAVLAGFGGVENDFSSLPSCYAIGCDRARQKNYRIFLICRVCGLFFSVYDPTLFMTAWLSRAVCIASVARNVLADLQTRRAHACVCVRVSRNSLKMWLEVLPIPFRLLITSVCLQSPSLCQRQSGRTNGNDCN